LVFTAVDDVAADAVVTAVALNLSLITVVVLSGLVDDVTVLNLREGEATFLGAGREIG
jgi:hypothetical protein